MEIAVIGGTGVYNPAMLTEKREIKVETPYGMITPVVGVLPKKWFCPAMARTIPFLPTGSIIWPTSGTAPYGGGTDPGDCGGGSLNQRWHRARLSSLTSLSISRRTGPIPFSRGECGVVHMDYTEPYCPELRKVLLTAAEDLELKAHDGGVYVCTEGPRFETPAEIRMFGQLGGSGPDDQRA